MTIMHPAAETLDLQVDEVPAGLAGHVELATSDDQGAAEALGLWSRYDLTDEEMREATTRYVDGLENVEGKYVGFMVDSPISPMFDVACSIERKIFEQHFEGNDEAYMRANYGPYAQNSQFLMVAERQDDGSSRPVAFMRIIRPEEGAESAKSLDDAAENIHVSTDDIRAYHGMDDMHDTWDVATLGMERDLQDTLNGAKARTILNRMFIRLATAERIGHMVAIIDEGALKGLLAVGIPVKPMAAPDGKFDKRTAFKFDGSAESYAVYGNIPQFYPSVARRHEELSGTKRFMKDLLRGGVMKAIKRRIYGKIAGQLVTGNSLDQSIALPGVE